MRNFFYAIIAVGIAFLATLLIMDDPRSLVADLLPDAACELIGCPDEQPFALPEEGLKTAFHPTLRPDGLRVARLESDFRYCNDDTGWVAVVPKDYYTNFATILWFLRFYINPQGDQMEAAVVHYWIYSVGGEPQQERRAQADKVFRDILKESGVNIIRRNLMYIAVSTAGPWFYNTSGKIDMRKENWDAYTIDAPTDWIVETVENCEASLPPPSVGSPVSE